MRDYIQSHGKSHMHIHNYASRKKPLFPLWYKNIPQFKEYKLGNYNITQGRKILIPTSLHASIHFW